METFHLFFAGTIATNAICSPSGDQVGDAGVTVTFVTWENRTLIIHPSNEYLGLAVLIRTR
jgi:hypothetical protein